MIHKLKEKLGTIKGVQRICFRGETEGGPPSTQPQPLGLGLPRARNFLIFNLFKRVFRSLFNAFCSNSSHICLNYRYKFLIYTFSISCLEILGGDSLPPKSLWGETVSLFSPPLCTPLVDGKATNTNSKYIYFFNSMKNRENL